MAQTRNTALPDPHRQAIFYRNVPGKRLAAWAIDAAVVLVAMLVLGLVTLTLAWWFWPVVWLAVDFLYRWATLAQGSATPGMRLMAIEVRNARGRPLDRQEAALHTGGYLLAASFVLPLLASLVLMLVTDRGQGLHDLALGSAVINRPG